MRADLALLSALLWLISHLQSSVWRGFRNTNENYPVATHRTCVTLNVALPQESLVLHDSKLDLLRKQVSIKEAYRVWQQSVRDEMAGVLRSPV
jgi:hypothetical protein